MTGQEIAIFAGPSLRKPLPPGFKLLPPAKQGDVLAQVRLQPLAIGLIDGYFEQAPAVWHKEILWALSQGVHVFGAASMGALRAAELHTFGMRGVGKIFHSYLTKATIDDDDVAVLHGPAELGYPVLTEAMVNVRETLRAAVEADILSRGTALTLEQIAKSIFYKERTWERVLAAASSTLAAKEFDAVSNWLPDGKVDLKQQDAEALIGRIEEFIASDPAPFEAGFEFEVTEHWAAAVGQSIDERSGDDVSEIDRLVLNEAFLADPTAKGSLASALLHAVVDDPDLAAGMPLREEDIAETYRAFRIRHQLLNRAALERWLDATGTNLAALEDLLVEETRSRLALRVQPTATLKKVLDQLHLSGGYEALERRALEKQRLLKSKVPSGSRPGPTLPPERWLLDWFFRSRAGWGVPKDLDIYAQEHGFSDVGELLEVLQQEYVYLMLSADKGH